MSGRVKAQNRGNKSGSTTEDVISVPNFTGMIQPFAMTTAPDGWLACDGSAVSRTTYGELFNAIGTTWGAGDGSTTFQVPKFEAAFLRGSGNHTSVMGNTNAFAGGTLSTISNDSVQQQYLGAQSGRVKIGGPDTGWAFIGRQIGNHGMAYRTGTFYYDHTQGGNSPYSSQFNYSTSMIDAGGTGTTSGGTYRGGGETKPFSASIRYMIKY